MVSIPFGLNRDLQLLEGVLALKRNGRDTIALQLQRHAEHGAERLFLSFAERRYTYGEANAIINRHAYAYKVLGIGPGDVVALVLDSRPEYVFHVLALHKIGAVASLVNHHVTGDGLAHALRICRPKHIVVGSENWPAFAEIHDRLAGLADDQIDVDVDPDQPCDVDAPVFQDRLVDASTSNPPEAGSQALDSQAAFIYTSGTTGLPKAARVSHMRMYRAGRVWAGVGFRYRPGDVLYICLPLYHSNAMLLGLSSAITAGVAVALARRFSAAQFWEDIRRFRCTSFLYIGELCRYLVKAPPAATDREHGLRSISGNGLRPDIWEIFRDRFAISRIVEFYGSTEGNCVTLNGPGVPGSVGPLLPGMALARWDSETEDFVRDRRGFVVKARRGESGVLLGRTSNSLAFEGYQDDRETEGRLLHSVFKEGDCYFNTGDLLRVDHRFLLYFVDRLGDTFRWKGENVATLEVQEQIRRCSSVEEVTVYGVQIPGTDGRAGMAALVIAQGERFDPVSFAAHVDNTLPNYARPVFVRVLRRLETTCTFKVKKADLQRQGFDPTACTDLLLFRHPESREYVPLDPGLHEAILSGRFSL